MVRFTTPILLLASLCLLLLAAPAIAETEAQWAWYRLQCLRKNPAIVGAVDRLCNRNLHMPSGVAHIGENYSPKNKVLVTPHQMCLMDGRVNLKSNIWIPKYWCERQFWKTCAQGDSRGTGWQIFGARGCQNFIITND